MYTLTRKPKTTIEFAFSVPWEELAPHISAAANEIGKSLKLDGFRPGKVPVEAVRQKFSDLEIVEQQLESIVSRLYYDAVKTEKLVTLGKPEVSIQKIAAGNPLEFRAVTALVPRVTPTNFRELSVKPREVRVEDQEIADALEELRKMRVAREQQNQNTENTKSSTPPVSPPFEGGVRGGSTAEPSNNEQMDLPELNDEFAKSLGKFENLETLKTALRENLKSEKEYEESVRQENVLVELLIEKSEFEELPEMLLASELEQVFHEFKHNIEHRGVVFADWLAGAKKTEKEFKKSLEPQALKRAKSSLLLRTISEQENLQPSEEETKEEIAELFRQYPDPKQQEQLTKPEFADYFRNVLVSKKTMKFLKDVMVKNVY